MTTSFDDLAPLLHGPAAKVVDDILDGEKLYPDDLTAGEMVIMATVLRAAWERKQAREKPPVVLKMVQNRRRRRTSKT